MIIVHFFSSPKETLSTQGRVAQGRDGHFRVVRKQTSPACCCQQGGGQGGDALVHTRTRCSPVCVQVTAAMTSAPQSPARVRRTLVPLGRSGNGEGILLLDRADYSSLPGQPQTPLPGALWLCLALYQRGV